MSSEQKIIKTDRYRLIYDKAALLRFFNMFFSDIGNKPYEVALMYLAYRRKYNPSVIIHEATCFDRKIVKYSDENIFYQLVRSYEIPSDGYTTREGLPAPEDAMVIYCMLNPRSTVKAWGMLQKEMSNAMEHTLLQKERSSNDPNKSSVPKEWKRIDSLYKNCVHKSRSRKPYFELDVDTKDPEVIERVATFLRTLDTSSWICTIETRGGYHVVFDTEKLGKTGRSAVYKEFTDKSYKVPTTSFDGKNIVKDLVEICSDPVEPIPVTVQGGFNVKFVEDSHILCLKEKTLLR
jgi:hypothetical protein